MTYLPGTRLKLGPMTGMTVDPYWLTITAVAKDGEITTADEDGMVDHVPAAIWLEEYEPRVQEVEEPGQNPDEPPMEEDGPEEIPFGGPEPDESGAIEPDEARDEAAPAPAPEPCLGADFALGYTARNMAANAESLKMAGVDPRKAFESHEPTDREVTPLERLADMVNQELNCEAMARKFSVEAEALSATIKDFLIDLAKKVLTGPFNPTHLSDLNSAMIATLRPPSDFRTGTRDPLATALGEAVEDRAPQEELPEVEPILTEQARAIANNVAAQVKEGVAAGEYETVSRLEMNRALREVRGISDAQAARMAEKGIKTLGNFAQAASERPDDWWSGMLYINKAKGDVIEQAVEDHWTRFKKKYGRA